MRRGRLGAKAWEKSLFGRFKAGLIADIELRLVAGELGKDLPVKVLQYGETFLALTFDQGILTTRVSGPLTPETLAWVNRHGEDAPGCTAVGLVVDYTAADVRLTGDELDKVMNASRLYQAGRPRALVIRAGDLSLFKDYALRFAMHGVLQRVFYGRDRATDWAIMEVELHGLDKRATQNRRKEA